jgi:formate-nitrite transporter family protein
MALPKIENPQSKPKAAEGAPQRELERPTAHEIFEQVSKNARQELTRTTLGLTVSGIAGGTTMGLTALATGIAQAQLGSGPWAGFAVHMLYPLGFIAVIVGRAQLFTENTLYPVALVLAERRHILATLRLWAIVLPSNIFGALLFALLASKTGALSADAVNAMANMGVQEASGIPAHIFWSGVMGGWLIALVAWLVSGSHSVTGSVALIWMLTFVVGLGGFAHCIAGSGQVMSAVLIHQLRWMDYLRWLGPTVGGNVVGGIMMVTLLEYGQTKGGD